MVYELVLHLKFSILAPKSMVPVIHFEGAFPHSPCAVEFIHGLFPLGILNPDAGVPSHSADQVFVFLAFAVAVIPEFGGVSEFLFGRTESSHLAVVSLADEMLGGALDWGRGFVFDAGVSSPCPCESGSPASDPHLSWTPWEDSSFIFFLC